MTDSLEFQQVYAAYAPLVRRILYGLAHPNDLDDLVQVTFMKVYENLNTLRDKKLLKSWICQIAVNTAKDRLRSRTRTSWMRFFIEDEADYIEGTEKAADFNISQSESLEKMLSQLSPKLREVIVFYSIEEFDVKEIAEILAIPEGTVKSRLHSAREILKKSLKGEEK